MWVSKLKTDWHWHKNRRFQNIRTKHLIRCEIRPEHRVCRAPLQPVPSDQWPGLWLTRWRAWWSTWPGCSTAARSWGPRSSRWLACQKIFQYIKNICRLRCWARCWPSCGTRTASRGRCGTWPRPPGGSSRRPPARRRRARPRRWSSRVRVSSRYLDILLELVVDI